MSHEPNHVLIMKRYLLTLLLLPIVATLATAQAPSLGGRQLESHYFAVGVGYPLNSYPDDTRELIEELQNLEGVSRIPIEASLAAYWPVLDNQTLIGASFGVVGDNLSRGSESISFNVMTLGASARRYLSGSIGDGPYARLDVGIATAGINHRIDDLSFNADGDVGIGGAAGAGYDLAISSGTSLELSATALYRNLPGHLTGSEGSNDETFEQGNYISASFGVALLW
jgi:hypothetical protein